MTRKDWDDAVYQMYWSSIDDYKTANLIVNKILDYFESLEHGRFYDEKMMELRSEIEDLKQKLDNLQADYDDCIEQTI